MSIVNERNVDANKGVQPRVGRELAYVVAAIAFSLKMAGQSGWRVADSPPHTPDVVPPRQPSITVMKRTTFNKLVRVEKILCLETSRRH